jgi:cytochrome c peroxidase
VPRNTRIDPRASRRRVVGTLTLLLCAALLAGAPGATWAKPFEWDIPSIFPLPAVPADNPMSWEKVELGRFLFYDPRMSRFENFSCASCHRQELAFTDGRGLAIGSLGEAGGLHLRGSMSLTNIAYSSGAALTWGNPAMVHLEQQALVPMFGDAPIVELGLQTREQLLQRLRADPRYQRLFAEAYPDEEDPISLNGVVRALASFQRSLISFNSPFDRYYIGLDDDAISLSALRGFELFRTDVRPGGLLECHHCHNINGTNFSSAETHAGTEFEPTADFQNTGLYQIEEGPCSVNDGRGEPIPANYPMGNFGKYDNTERCEHMGQFKAPTLRNVAVTAPYMHDGSIATLGEVLDHYAAGGRAAGNPLKSTFLAGFPLTQREKQDVIAFLESLTDEEFLTNPKFADPFVPPLCTGDCDYDGVVEVDELVTGVGIHLESETLASCIVGDADGDGDLGLAEMVQAINGALRGCPEPFPSQ